MGEFSFKDPSKLVDYRGKDYDPEKMKKIVRYKRI